MTQSKLSRSRVAIVAKSLALTALAFCAGLASGNPLRAEPVTVYEAGFAGGVSNVDVGAAPVLLVANPEFKDPQWRETVLLATQLPNGGHIGVIINRPIMELLWKELSVKTRGTLVGGPLPTLAFVQASRVP